MTWIEQNDNKAGTTPGMSHGLICPVCKQELIINLTESVLEPPRVSVALQLWDGHEIDLNTTHYAESNQVVSRLLLAVITHCPKKDKHGLA